MAAWTRNQTILFWGVGVSAAAVVVTATISLVTLAIAANERAKQERKTTVVEWQKVIVYNAIRTNMLEKREGLAFNDIRRAYLDAATVEQGIDLRKEELSDLAIRKILLELMAAGLLGETANGGYISQLYSVNSKFDRTWLQTEAFDLMFTEVNKENGKLTVADLDLRLLEKTKLTRVEFERLLTDMMTFGYIIRDSNGKLWHPLKPPK